MPLGPVSKWILDLVGGSHMAAMAASAPTDLRSIALLIDQLKHDDLSLRVNSTRALVAIATALGPDRTRNELIPFLCESTDDEDEVLVVMAEQLGALQPCVGGVDQLHCLLEPLEALATVEESTVRDKAVASIRALATAMPAPDLVPHYMPLCRRLAGKDWFTARISACGLLAIAHARVPAPQQDELRGLFARLCRDDTPMVRRVAAANLGLLAEAVADATVIERELLPLLTMLGEDDQDSVRLQTVDNCATFAGALREGVVEGRLMPVVLDVVQDRSWRVRWSAASKFERLCAALGSTITNGKLCPAYVALLQDVEAEVRAAAGFNVVAVAGLMELSTVLSQLLPCVQQLTLDASEHVRTALASGINDLAPILGREHTIEQLIPLLLNLLRDSSSEVRLNIIAKLDAIHRVIGVERLSQSLLPAIIDLAEDHKWRVRMAIIEHIPLLAQQLGASSRKREPALSRARARDTHTTHTRARKRTHAHTPSCVQRESESFPR